jgi:hypothetical protein
MNFEVSATVTTTFAVSSSYPDDGGSRLLRNVVTSMPEYSESHHIRHQTSSTAQSPKCNSSFKYFPELFILSYLKIGFYVKNIKFIRTVELFTSFTSISRYMYYRHSNRCSSSMAPTYSPVLKSCLTNPGLPRFCQVLAVTVLLL